MEYHERRFLNGLGPFVKEDSMPCWSEKAGPQVMKLRSVPEAVVKELRTGVESSRWATAEAARIWLQKKCGIKRPYVTVWSWLKN